MIARESITSPLAVRLVGTPRGAALTRAASAGDVWIWPDDGDDESCPATVFLGLVPPARRALYQRPRFEVAAFLHRAEYLAGVGIGFDFDAELARLTNPRSAD